MDLSGLTDDDLVSILAAQDLQDVRHLSRSEKEALVRTFIPDSVVDGPPVSEGTIQAQPNIEFPSDIGVSFTEIAYSHMDVSFIDQNTNDQVDGSATVNQATENEEVSEEQSLLISQFCEMTGKDPSYAKNVLEATAWNMETAVSLHLEGISSGLSRTNSYQPVPHPPFPMDTVGTRTSEFPLPIPHDLPGAEDWQRIMNMRRYISHEHLHHPMGDDDDDDEENPTSRMEYDEEGIRRPDPVKMQRLISRGYSSERSLGRAEDPTVDWLFPPPRHLSSQEALDQVRVQGKEEKRWVLVNIQSHQEFPSHLLNRDTWPNESVESILRTSYLFWQRGHTTQDGRDFMRLYHVSEDQLPHIAILDPRTGASITSWTGFIEPAELVLKLTDFADRHTLEPGPNSSSQNNNNSGRNSLQASDLKDDLPLKAEKIVEEKIAPKELDFGPVPATPDDTDVDGVKISIKLANGKSVTRKYHKFDPVRVLFAVAVEADDQNKTKPFDLISRFPPLTLSTCMEKTIDECKLGGGNLLHRWL